MNIFASCVCQIHLFVLCFSILMISLFFFPFSSQFFMQHTCVHIHFSVLIPCVGFTRWVCALSRVGVLCMCKGYHVWWRQTERQEDRTAVVCSIAKNKIMSRRKRHIQRDTKLFLQFIRHAYVHEQTEKDISCTFLRDQDTWKNCIRPTHRGGSIS